MTIKKKKSEELPWRAAHETRLRPATCLCTFLYGLQRDTKIFWENFPIKGEIIERGFLNAFSNVGGVMSEQEIHKIKI